MDIAELASENAALRAQNTTNNEILNNISDGVTVADAAGRIVWSNTAAGPLLRTLGIREPDDNWKDLPMYFLSDGVTPYPVADLPLARAVRGEVVNDAEIYIRNQGQTEGTWILCNCRPLYAEDKSIRGAVSVFRDITERKRWERDMERQLVREKEKNELLERMRNAIDELSTPILEVWDDVLAVPVIGIVDSRRAAEMMTRVLETVEKRQCRYLILDITGIDVIDTATADRFLKLVTAAEILGVQCLLTGARAVVAATLASIGMDLRGLTTLRNLKHGLVECIRAMEAAPRQSMLREIMTVGQRRG